MSTANQRLKILYLAKFFADSTDEEHPVTMQQIIAELDRHGISAARKAIYEDIEALCVFGMDIVSVKGKYSGYYLASREFELPELKLLADAVSSARFLTQRKSEQLLKKIESLASVYEGRQIQRQVYVTDRVKSMNEKIYLNVDAINLAISSKKQIAFKYFDYGADKKKKYREGLRVCSPYALTWSDERYYLVAYYEKYGSISNFRVDRMESVQLLEEPIKTAPADFSLPKYLNSTFSMFSGEVCDVCLKFSDKLVNAVLDRFGKDVWLVPAEEGWFTARVKVKPEPPFFGWLFQFADKAQIISPESVKLEYLNMLKAAADAQK